MNRIRISVNREELKPTYTTKGAAGADIRADIENSIILKHNERILVPTGISCEIPEGFEIQIRPRSGLALKHGITVLNAPGTIDSDYRGEIKVILINFGGYDFEIEPMMRIAQIVVAPVVVAEFDIMRELSETARGSGGFGHTGA